MTPVVVFGLRASLEAHRAALSDAIHDAIMEALSYPPEKRFPRFMGLDSSDFIYPKHRGPNYTTIDVSIFEGRSNAARRTLTSELFERIESGTGISPHSVETTITETPKVNWGIRGRNAADLALDHEVEV